MAKTDGHGNPNWTRDETILALDLYFTLGGNIPSGRDHRIIGLSETLRSMPYHKDAAKKQSFRNPDGVSFKLQNLRQVATGKGLGNVSQTDRNIWEEFGARPTLVASMAAAIRIGIESQIPDEPEGEVEFAEGRLLTQLHYRRERNRKLRAAFFSEKRQSGFVCEICDLSRNELPTALEEAVFEAHHIIAVSEAGERKTKISDLALLCACCHRLIHKAISMEKRWIGIGEARSLLNVSS
jgi:5-methylcytosine-specific restriction protein A